eukprot:9052359-Karenia_brevis.AAC.1
MMIFESSSSFRSSYVCWCYFFSEMHHTLHCNVLSSFRLHIPILPRYFQFDGRSRIAILDETLMATSIRKLIKECEVDT